MSEHTKPASEQDDPTKTSEPKDASLGEQELDQASGGLNPQPLPPDRLPWY